MSSLKNDSPNPIGQPTIVGLSPGQALAFACARCGRCCANQVIQLNPHEVWRLARGLGLATSAFIAAHTHDAGLFLRFSDDGRCGFLTPAGCAVHPHRPLACRLYPLGLEEDAAGREVFAPLVRHPGCQGDADPAGRGATVAEFLAGQGIAPYLAAQRAYLGVAREIEAGLDGLEQTARRRSLAGLVGDGRAPGPWQDLDLAIGPGQTDPAQALARHLAFLRGWLADQG